MSINEKVSQIMGGIGFSVEMTKNEVRSIAFDLEDNIEFAKSKLKDSNAQGLSYKAHQLECEIEDFDQTHQG